MNYVGGNPSATHTLGRKTAHILDEARSAIRSNFKACDDLDFDVIFTSGATESNNMVMYSFEGPILVSAIEHASVLNAVPNVEILDVDTNGIIDINALETWLQNQTRQALVSIMYANNETGALQPIDEISKLCRQYGALFHCDIVQIFGKCILDMTTFDVVSLSAHKIGGFSGIGALIYSKKFPLKSLMKGGFQQLRKRPGTENIIGALSFIAALAYAKELRDKNIWQEIKKLRDRFESEILEISPESHVSSFAVERLVNTSLISMPGVNSEKQVMLFDLSGICVSAGSACSSGVIKESHVLKAMALKSNIIQESIRISLQPETQFSDITYLIETWKKIFNKTSLPL